MTSSLSNNSLQSVGQVECESENFLLINKVF